MNIPTSSDGKTFDRDHIIFYPYTPSKPAALAFVALFGTTTLAHLLALLPFRSWFFIPLILGGIVETFGYYGRSLAADDTKGLGPFMMQNLLILSGPLFIAATVYMTLGRLTRALDAEEYALIGSRWVSKLYVTADILSFITQFAGAGVQITGDARIMDIGKKAVVGGLVVHAVLFLFFIFMTARIHLMLNRNSKSLPQASSLGWRRYFWALYVCSIAILVRNLVRVVEFAQGADSAIAKSEVMIYVFDAALMLFTMVVLLIVHPGRLMKAARKKGGRFTELKHLNTSE